MIEFEKYDVLTFDCYGTLIDWESGILAALRPVLSTHDINLSDEAILQLYSEFESEQEKGEYIKYREVLRRVVQNFGKRLDFEPSLAELDSLANSVKNWQPFLDTVGALEILQDKFKLAIVSNVDNDLFAFTAKHLSVEFDWIITAEQLKSYKPSLNNFKQAIARIGLPLEKILHVANSIYHDIIPASSLGMSTVWVQRGNQKESGAAPSASGQPDLEVPDLITLASLISPRTS